MKGLSKLTRSTLGLTGLFLFILDLALFKSGVISSVTLAYFLMDYIGYRREAILNYQASRTLREGMTLSEIRAIERKYLLRDDFNTFEKHAEVRTPLDRYFYYAKYERVRDLVDFYGPKAGTWLDAGCGFGEDTFYLAKWGEGKIVGLELDEIKLSEASRKFQKDPSVSRMLLCAGDMLHAPFRPGTFDAILMTEVLEHLINPNEGIQICQSLLRDGGTLIVSTPSLHNLDYSANPFRILEKVLSLVDDRILPPYHGLHAQFEYTRKRPEPEYGIHYHFSQRQLAEMVTQHQFEILWEGSFEMEVVPYLYMEKILRGKIDKIRKVVQPIEAILERIPVLNRLGQHLLLVARKIPVEFGKSVRKWN